MFADKYINDEDSSINMQASKGVALYFIVQLCIRRQVVPIDQNVEKSTANTPNYLKLAWNEFIPIKTELPIVVAICVFLPEDSFKVYS
jgi:hypothetical protein